MRLKLEAVATLGLWMFCSACVCHKLMMLQTEKFHLEIQIAAYEKWEEVAALGPHSRPVMVGASSTEGAPVLLPWLSPLATAPDCRLGVWVAPTPWSLSCCWLVAQRSASLLFLRTRCLCLFPPARLLVLPTGTPGRLGTEPLPFALFLKALSGAASAWIGNWEFMPH